MNQNLNEKQIRFQRDDIPTRLGNLASNLARIKSFSNILMSQRLNAILPDNVYEELLRFAQVEKRTKSQIAALLIEAIATRKSQENEAPSSKKDKQYY